MGWNNVSGTEHEGQTLACKSTSIVNGMDDSKLDASGYDGCFPRRADLVQLLGQNCGHAARHAAGVSTASAMHCL
jgi:hypothetical protein